MDTKLWDDMFHLERAVLEPGGTITMIAKKPVPEAERHAEVVARLDQVTRELAAWRTAQPPPQA